MPIATYSLEAVSSAADYETGGTLIINLEAIAANWQSLARKLANAECGAVIKANAYGLGLERVVARLVKAGCKTFFVADIAEPRRARSQTGEASIYVLGGFSPKAANALAELNVRPVINSVSELKEWDAFVAAQRWHGGAAVHVDTGMNRLGISMEEAAALASRLKEESHGLTLLISHLACAEVAKPPAEFQSDTPIPLSAQALSRGASISCQLLGDLSWRRRTFRPRETWRSSVWYQPRARSAQSDATCHRALRPHPPSAQNCKRDRCRLWRRLESEKNVTHCCCCCRLRRRPVACRKRPQPEARWNSHCR